MNSPGDAAAIAVERLNSALYFRRVSEDHSAAWIDVALSIAASLTRLWMAQPPDRTPPPAASSSQLEDRLVTIERQLVALANSERELYARVDRLTEQVELGQ